MATGFSKLRLPDGFDRDMSLLTLSMSSRRIAMGFLQVVRAIYFALLGFTPLEIGLLLSLATFISAIHNITFGVLSDRYGRKIFLVLGGIFATLRMVIFALSHDFWMLALGQGIGAMGEGAGAGQPVVSGYISDKVSVVNRAPVFSTLAITSALAATVGSLLAGLPAYFQESLGFDMIAAHSLLFWIGAAGGIASLLFLLPLKDVKPERHVEDVLESASGGRSLGRSWSMIAKFSLIRSTSGLGYGLIESLLPLYFFIRFNVGGEFLGPIYALARFISMFSYLLIPWFVDRYGEIPTIVASRLVSGFLAVALSIASSLPVAVVVLVVFRINASFTMPIRQVIATGIVSPEETATAIGVSNFARMGLRTLAPTAAGYMFEAVSLSMPFLTGAVLIVANGLLYKFFLQKR